MESIIVKRKNPGVVARASAVRELIKNHQAEYDAILNTLKMAPQTPVMPSQPQSTAQIVPQQGENPGIEA